MIAKQLMGRGDYYIALEDYDLSFDETALEKFIAMWRAGVTLKDITKKLRRREIEVAVLVIDLAESGVISKR